MTEKYTHYTMFGAFALPSCADEAGFLKWRDGFEKLPQKDWTEQEKWIHEAEAAVRLRMTLMTIVENHKKDGNGPAGTVRTGGFRKPEDKP